MNGVIVLLQSLDTCERNHDNNPINLLNYLTENNFDYNCNNCKQLPGKIFQQ